MSQHFLLSRPAKTLSLAQVFRMTDTEAEVMFRKVRWPETNGEPVCPHCGGVNAYECRRPNGLLRFRCRACREDFTITSGTLFAFHKLPLRGYLAAIVIFCNEVKGKSALAISRDLGLSYKAAFVLLHKLREAMAEEMKGRKLGGEGQVAEIDGGYFGGYVKPANHVENRRDRRLACNQNGKRKAVVIIRERNGHSLPAVFRTEGQALSFIRSRRAEQGHHHHIAGPYLLRYAQEASWREDNRRVSNGDQAYMVSGLAMKRKPSVDFCGYWQRHSH
jgi:transposase-like protein